jgi:hypothetical protein
MIFDVGICFSRRKQETVWTRSTTKPYYCIYVYSIATHHKRILSLLKRIYRMVINPRATDVNDDRDLNAFADSTAESTVQYTILRMQASLVTYRGRDIAKKRCEAKK